MGAVRARVELKEPGPNASRDERWGAFKKMLSAFNKARSAAGVEHECKRHEHYESPGRKRRRKRKESEEQQLKAKLKENFPKRGKK